MKENSITRFERGIHLVMNLKKFVVLETIIYSPTTCYLFINKIYIIKMKTSHRVAMPGSRVTKNDFKPPF